MYGVSLRDARCLLEVAAAIEYDSARCAFTSEGLTSILELFEADWVTYCEGPGGPTRITVTNEVETRPFAGHCAELEAIFDARFHEYKLGCQQAPEHGVVLMGDVTTDRAWRRTGVYNEWCREVHIQPQAKLSLSAPGAPWRRTLMFDLAEDAGRSFGERERTLLTLIRPALLRPIALLEVARERKRALGLTRRELEVLDLVRAGMTNSEIAAQLYVSPATIRTHLENAFAKIGAHTRTEAITRLSEISTAPRS
jgi:DNA-binding CsgD family transcriptional regulator